MRVVFIGASALTKATVQVMLEAEHEIVVIEKDLATIELISEDFDCSFVHGDGSRPSVLEDVDPGSTDVLFCLSDDDNANILAALLARSMDFKKVVVRIEDLELQPVCDQLKLEHVIIPDRRVAEGLKEFLEGDADKPPLEK